MRVHKTSEGHMLYDEISMTVQFFDAGGNVIDTVTRTYQFEAEIIRGLHTLTVTTPERKRYVQNTISSMRPLDLVMDDMQHFIEWDMENFAIDHAKQREATYEIISPSDSEVTQ
jgi:hypothetical protein